MTSVLERAGVKCQEIKGVSSLFQGLALWEVEAELIERGLVQLCRGQSSGSVDLAAGPGGAAFPHPSSPYLFPLPKVAEAEDIPKQKERTHFTVRLTEAKPVDKVKLIKEIKNYVQGINLVQVRPHSEPSPMLGGESSRALDPFRIGFVMTISATSSLLLSLFRPRS